MAYAWREGIDIFLGQKGILISHKLSSIDFIVIVRKINYEE